MATINTVTFSAGTPGTAGVYNQGDTITVTVDYTADTPSVVAAPFTLTTTITDSGGTVTATNDSTFTVNQQQQGDKVSEADSGNRTWAEGTTSPQSDGSLQVAFTATA